MPFNRPFVLAAFALLALALTAPAATTPYTDDFDDDPTGNAAPTEPAPESGTFNEDVDNTWSVIDQGGGDHAYRLNTTGDDHGARPVVSTLDLGSAFSADQTFTIATDFKLNSFSDDGSRITAVGFGALGNNAAFSDASDYYLGHFFVGWPDSPGNVGRVQLFENGGDSALGPTLSASAIAVNTNDTYRLTLSGRRDGAALDLTAVVENLRTYESTRVDATDPTPLTGGHFGWRNAMASSDASSSLDARFDNFQVNTEPLATSNVLDNGLDPDDVDDRRYLSYVTDALDTLIAQGGDRYGSTANDKLLVSVMDVRTKAVVHPDPADEQWRVIRPERRSPNGHNFLHDQDTLRVLRNVSAVTGQSNYADFAADYTDAAANLNDQNGMFWWGWHRHLDVTTEQQTGHLGNHHEIHSITHPDWTNLLERNPQATATEIEQIWQRHVVDKSTGQINRHDNGVPGRSFIMSSGAYIEAFAAMYARTNDQTWLDRAKLLAGYNWNRRNTTTKLLASSPNDTSRWDGVRATTTLPGLYAPSLLIAWQATGETTFRDQALAYLEAYADHGFDTNTGSFWGSLELDGTPVPGPRLADGSYAQFEPRGLVDLWSPYAAGYEQPIAAARAYALAYKLTGDADMLDTAEKWADLILAQFPADQTRQDTWYDGYSDDFAEHGAHAEKYGRALLFFLDLHDATGEAAYLDHARTIANEGIANLWYEGLFRGHQAKPYYEAIDGVGLFMDGLVRLDQAVIPEPGGAALLGLGGLHVLLGRRGGRR